MSGFEERLGRALVAWVDAARRAAAWVVALAVLATIGAGAYAAANLSVFSDLTELISHDVPYYAVRKEYEAAFPLLEDIILVVIDADTPERASDAAEALAARFAEERDAFQAVYLPGGGPFFERNGLLYLDTDELEELADHLAEAQPYLAELARDPSLRGLFALLQQALEALRTGEISGLDPAPVFERISVALEALHEDRAELLSWEEVVLGETPLPEERRRVILLSPVLDFSDLQPARAAVVRVRRILEESAYAQGGPVRVRLTGDFVLAFEEWEVVRRQASGAGVASFVLVAIILTLALRSAWLIMATLATLIVGLSLSLGFAAAAVGHLNPISVAFAVLFIGLGVDFGIHLCMRYQELRRAESSHAEALRETARGVGSSLVLCAVTTAIGFYAFLPTDFLGVAELGLIAGTAMFICLFCSLTVLPAILTLAPDSIRSRWGRPAAVRAFPELTFPVLHPRVVRAAVLGLVIAAVALLPRVRFDHNPLNVRDPATESVQTFRDLLESSQTSPWSISVLAPDLESAHDTAHRLEQLEVVEQTLTALGYVPSEQSEKLDIIGEIALFLGPPPGKNGAAPPLAEEQLGALRSFLGEVDLYLAENGGEQLAQNARRLAAAVDRIVARILASPDPTREIDRLEGILLGPMERRIALLHEALRAGPVALEDLPAVVRDRMVARDGRARIEVFPSEDLSDNAALARFVDDVRTITPNASGPAVNILQSARVIVASFRQALVSAAVLIALVLWILWRRFDDMAVVLVTLGLAAAFTGAVSVLAGIPFNFADVIVLPLLLGIGVDSSIHLVHRYRTESGGRGNLLKTSTARAVFYSALTTIASFGSLGLTSHKGMASLGQMLTIGVALTLICNLAILPALIRRRPGGR